MTTLLALLSIYPTVKIVSWGKALRLGRPPNVRPETLRTLRMIIHAELAGIVLIILFAAMMARGVGFSA
jgi:putative membrane protein